MHEALNQLPARAEDPYSERLGSGSPTTEHGDAEVLKLLAAVCVRHGLSDLGGDLSEILGVLAGDLASLGRHLDAIDGGSGPVGGSIDHLMGRPGKRLRPLCAALASHVGTGFSPAARELATAVELVHTATLLHDDVVDLGTLRRGLAPARLVYGNAASIFAGDRLLIEALRCVHRAGFESLMLTLFDVVDEMIAAESIQLALAGSFEPDEESYFKVVRGKTASLFRFALESGAVAGGLDREAVGALGRFGLHLGMAFQLIDDVLDVDGDAFALGKQVFQDLSEGKLTYPFILALEAEPSARVIFEEQRAPEVAALFSRTGAVERAHERANQEARLAKRALEELGTGWAVTALRVVADAVVDRRF